MDVLGRLPTITPVSRPIVISGHGEVSPFKSDKEDGRERRSHLRCPPLSGHQPAVNRASALLAVVVVWVAMVVVVVMAVVVRTLTGSLGGLSTARLP